MGRVLVGRKNPVKKYTQEHCKNSFLKPQGAKRTHEELTEYITSIYSKQYSHLAFCQMCNQTTIVPTNLFIFYKSSIDASFKRRIEALRRECIGVCKEFVSEVVKLAQDWKTQPKNKPVAEKEKARRRHEAKKPNLRQRKKPRKKQENNKSQTKRNKSASKRYNNSSEILYRDARRQHGFKVL